VTDQPTPPRQYPVGAIINGHVWTGTEWVPAVVVPTSLPEPRPPSWHARFDSLPLAGRIGIVAVIIAVGLPIAFYVTSALDRL
jgi:hypothetical protein